MATFFLSREYNICSNFVLRSVWIENLLSLPKILLRWWFFKGKSGAFRFNVMTHEMFLVGEGAEFRHATVASLGMGVNFSGRKISGLLKVMPIRFLKTGNSRRNPRKTGADWMRYMINTCEVIITGSNHLGWWWTHSLLPPGNPGNFSFPDFFPGQNTSRSARFLGLLTGSLDTLVGQLFAIAREMRRGRHGIK